MVGAMVWGEKRLGPRNHFLATVGVALGSWLSGYFILTTNAFMQHPTGYTTAADGSLRLANFAEFLLNPWALIMFLHNQCAALVTGSFVVAAVGALYALRGKHAEQASLFLKTGTLVGLCACVLVAFPTGDQQAKMVARHQPVSLAAMEGHFHGGTNVALNFIGQPNVGKSSLLNALVGDERNIVSDIAGTTRDTIHTHYNMFQKDFMLIDTAGIRRKAKVQEDLEFYSVIRAIKAVDEADVVMLLLDAEKGITAQDLSIYSLAARKGKGVVVLVNKWDLVEKATNTARDYEKELKNRLAPFSDVPIIFTSVTEKQRIFKAIETALEVYENRLRRIPTSTLNEVMLKAIEAYHPPVVRGIPIRIKYVTQLPTHTPAFAFFCNLPDDVKTPYRNYLENQLRSNFDFKGVPLKLFFRKK